MKRNVNTADWHSGHKFGLTPPKWQSREGALADQQRLAWDWWVALMDRLQPIDLLTLAGDALDGKGPSSGGTEQITSDREEQCAMVVEGAKAARPKQVMMVHGTGYHVGDDEDWETVAANYIRDRLGIPVQIGAHESADVNGLIFDVKHKIGASQIPHGRFTPTAREALWNGIWAERKQRPRANVIIRAHVHYFTHCGSPGDNWMGLTLPAMQGLGSKYGSRQCSGTVDQGVVWFDVESPKNFTWGWDLIPASQFPAGVLCV